MVVRNSTEALQLTRSANNHRVHRAREDVVLKQ